MANSSSPYLCGGTFFVLLLQARKQRTKARDKFNGGTDGLSDTDVLKGLIYVVTQKVANVYKESFKKNTSEYKSCQYSGGTYITFNEKPVIFSFDNDVKNKYSDTLGRMSEFINEYLDLENGSKIEWLVKALLEVIELDTDIKDTDTDTFFIQSNGHALRKKDLALLADIDFQPFLLGVLHYIILNRQDNKLGRATYEAWHKKSTQNSEWEFTSNIGSGIDRSLNISLLPVQEEYQSEEEEIPKAETQQDDATDTSSTKIVNQFINNPTIVNQYGEKNFHIDHVGVLKL